MTQLRNLISLLLFCSFSLTAAAATPKKIDSHGFTLVVFYDRASTEAVRNFKAETMATPPFSNLKGWFKIRTFAIKPQFLKCINLRDSRLVTCDNEVQLTKFGQQLGADRTLVFTGRASGGSGGQKLAVIAGDSYYPQGFHEFLHQLGFSDEYRYEVSPYGDYMCGNIPQKSPNVIYQNISSLKFSSEASARAYLSKIIPWVSKIPKDIPILTNGRLGTPTDTYPAGTLGLFRGGACDYYKEGWIAQEYSVMNSDYFDKVLISPYYASLIKRELFRVEREEEEARTTIFDRLRPTLERFENWISKESGTIVRNLERHYNL